jgi:hypothetical protein
MLSIYRLKIDGDLLGRQWIRNQSTDGVEPASSLAGENGPQRGYLLLVSSLVKISPQSPASVESIAGDTKV